MMESALGQAVEEQARMVGKLKAGALPRASTRRLLMSAALIGSDLLALLLAGCAALWLRTLASEIPTLGTLPLSGYFSPAGYARLIPLLGIFPIVYASRGLYPTIGLNRVDELRLLTISTSLVAALYATLLFFAQQGMSYSRLVFALFWLLALILVPSGRVLTRKSLVWLSLWGVPVGLIGSGVKTRWTAQFLAAHPNLGFLPMVLFDGSAVIEEQGPEVPRVDMDLLEQPAAETLLKRLDTLVVVQSETPPRLLHKLVARVNHSLPRIVMMPDLPQVGSIWVRPIDLGGVLALKIRNNLANPWQRFLKRSLDLDLGLLFSLVGLPLMLLIAAGIKLESRGPLFYAHSRIGRDGRRFTCWKFRTMVRDAEERLRAYLAQNPEMREEWEANQKLRQDPRVTRVGRFLRKLSLDELPQLWNVLKGDMSLIGPRPIVDGEGRHYQDAFDLYKSVRPGITGLWQVSGRNDVGYNTRVALDSYYVRNWSVWLDLYILARTPIAVFSRKGAY